MALGSALSSAAGALTSGPVGSGTSYKQLQDKYRDFAHPQAQVTLGDSVFSNSGGDMIISDIHVELTSGFEASIARFRIYNVYDSASGSYRFSEIKKQIAMGTTLTLDLGYLGELETVFVGFVAGVSFGYEPGELPYIEITGMDVKGIMMAGRYVNQLTADNYADAVREILKRTGYEQLKSGGGIVSIEVTDTPDVDETLLAALQAQETAQTAAEQAQRAADTAMEAAQASGSASALAAAQALQEKANQALSAVDAAKKAFQAAKEVYNTAQTAAEEIMRALAEASKAGLPSSPVSVPMGPTSDYTVEMNAESDYEFMVKAAKKFNFEFFVDRGTVYFRKAKSNNQVLMELSSNAGMLGFNIEYSITGIVGSIEARSMNPGEGKIVSSSSTFTNTISTGSAAKGLVNKGKMVLIDPTIANETQAAVRVASLMERMSYRLGTLEADCVGIPDLVPGRFIKVSGLGAPADNYFYVTSVEHDFRDDSGYHTHIVACTDKVDDGGDLI